MNRPAIESAQDRPACPLQNAAAPASIVAAEPPPKQQTLQADATPMCGSPAPLRDEPELRVGNVSLAGKAMRIYIEQVAERRRAESEAANLRAELEALREELKRLRNENARLHAYVAEASHLIEVGRALRQRFDDRATAAEAKAANLGRVVDAVAAIAYEDPGTEPKFRSRRDLWAARNALRARLQVALADAKRGDLDKAIAEAITRRDDEDLRR